MSAMKTGTFVVPGTAEQLSVVFPNARERRLLRLIAEAKTAKGMADLLFVSANTVHGHIRDLGREIGAAQKPPRPPLSQAELQVWVMQNPEAMHPGGVIMREHPPNCPCGGNGHCRAMFVVKQ